MLELFAGRSVGFAATFLIPVVLARLLSQSDFGTYRQLFLVFATFFGVAQLGMAENLYYFLPGRRDGGHFLANSLLFLSGAGAACTALLYFAAPWVSRWMNNPALAELLPLIGVFLAAMLASTILEVGWTAAGRYRWAAIAYMTSDTTRAAALVTPAFLFGDLRLVMLGAVSFAVLRLLVTVGCLAAEWRRSFLPEWPALKAQLAYATPFAAAVLVDTLQSYLHQYVVARRFDAATFALYSVACLQIPVVDLAATSAGNVLMVRLAQPVRDGHRAVAREAWLDATGNLVLVFLPLVALLWVTAQDLVVLLFTDTYAASVPVFRLACLGILLGILPTDSALRAHADTRFLLGMNTVRLLLVIASIAPLLASLGMAGAMLATLLGGVVAKVMAARRVASRFAVHLWELVPWKTVTTGLVASLLAIATSLLAAAETRGSTLLRLIVTSTVFAVTYYLVLAGARLVHGRERSTPKCVALPES